MGMSQYVSTSKMQERFGISSSKPQSITHLNSWRISILSNSTMSNDSTSMKKAKICYTGTKKRQIKDLQTVKSLKIFEQNSTGELANDLLTVNIMIQQEE
ncbi:hypothetical protein Glove_341g27 [Diversispora epigaea]|uniref:Uncharacterized protein n=1 Tax=Diversispora epigaea TaxID=1348612 RepID=A0A397HH07_9GLOM|nr:hypothetical protein Glove_341g27 [Diversispora epigaea]